MKSEAVKLAQIERDKVVTAELSKFLTHPYMMTLLCFILIEYLQATQVNGKPLMGSVAGSTLEGALVVGGTLQSLGKSGALESLIPLLIAKGG